MCFLAGLTIGTETSKVEFAESFADVLFGAVWSEGAKTLLVVRAGGEFGVGVDV